MIWRNLPVIFCVCIFKKLTLCAGNSTAGRNFKQRMIAEGCDFAEKCAEHFSELRLPHLIAATKKSNTSIGWWSQFKFSVTGRGLLAESLWSSLISPFSNSQKEASLSSSTRMSLTKQSCVTVWHVPWHQRTKKAPHSLSIETPERQRGSLSARMVKTCKNIW